MRGAPTATQSSLNARRQARWPPRAGGVRQDHRAHQEAVLRLRPGARRPGGRVAEGGPRRVQRRLHVPARRPRLRDRRVPDDAAPRLRQAGGTHRRLEPAQADVQVVLGDDAQAACVRQPEDRGARAAHLRRDPRHHHRARRAAQRRDRVRPRLRVRLLRLQDAREVVPAEDERQDRRAAAADADARRPRHPQARHRRGDRVVPPDVGEVVHARDADDVQRRDDAAADVVVLPPLDAGRLDRGDLRHAEALRADLKVERRRRPLGLEHPRVGLLHRRHQRHVERARADAARLQQHGALRQPGRRQAAGLVRRVHRAVARRHLRLPRPAQEPRQGGGARARPLLRAVGARPLHEARRGERRVVALLPARVPRALRLVGCRVRGALREVRGGGEGAQDDQGAGALVRRPRLADRNGDTVRHAAAPRLPRALPPPRPAAAAPRAVAPGARAILRPLPSPPRLVAGTSCTRTRRTRSRTSRTSARSAARTCAPRSSSTRRPTRSPSATSRRSRCRASPSTAPSTTRSCTTSRTSSPRTSTA